MDPLLSPPLQNVGASVVHLSRQQRAACLLPIAGVALALAVAWLVKLYVWPGIPELDETAFLQIGPRKGRTDLFIATDLVARLTWGTAELVLAALMVCAGITSILFMLDATAWLPRNPRYAGVALITAIALLAGVCVFDRTTDACLKDAGKPAAPTRLSGTAFQCLVLDSLQNAEERWLPAGTSRFHSVTRLTSWTNSMALSVMILLLGSFCCVAWVPATLAVAELARRKKEARYLVYLAGALLAATVIELLVLLRWPASLMVDAAAGAAMEAIAASMTALAGSALTLILIGLALPAIAVLNTFARELAHAATGEATEPIRSKWLEDHGLGGSTWRSIAQVVAALGPVLAGLLGGPLTTMITDLLKASG